MSNVQAVRAKKIPIELDKPRSIMFDLNAFAELEEIYGSVEKAMKTLEEGSVRGIRALLWAGLIHEELDDKGEPLITAKQVGSWIDLTEIETIGKKLAEAIRGATPQETPQETPGEKKPPVGEAPLAQKSSSTSQ